MILISRRFSISKWHVVAILTLVVLLVIANCVIRAGFHFSIDYNEGWNVSYSNKILNNELLYSNISPYIHNNYPPFSFYFIALISSISGNILIVGRYVSLLSVISISFIVAFIVKKAGGDIYESIFSGVFCLGLFSILANYYVGMNDPQLFGNLFGTLALLVYIKSYKRHLFFITLLLTISIFIKHSLIILPITLLVDLLLDNYKKAFKYILFMCIDISLFVVLIFIISEEQFLSQIFILETTRNFSAYQAVRNSSFALAWIQLPIVVGLISSFYFSNENVTRTILIYIIFSIIIGIYFTGGAGVDVNVFFDLFISLSIAIGFALKYFRIYIDNGNIPKAIKWLLPLLISFGLVLQSPGKIVRPDLLKKYAEKEKDFLNDTEILKMQNGQLLSEDMLLCYYSGKEFVFDAFSVSQLLQSGKLDEKKLIKNIEQGKYSIIQLNDKINPDYNTDTIYGSLGFSGRFSNNTLKAIEKYYTLFHTSGNGVYYHYAKNN